MEKALGNGSAIVVCKNACCAYTQGIYEDGNGNTGKYQNRSLSKGFLGKIREHGPEGQQRDKGSNPTAGLGHRKSRISKFDNVSLPQNRNIQQVQGTGGNAGCKKLHGEGDLSHHNRWNGDHEYQERDGKEQNLKVNPSEKKKDNT